MKRYTIQELKSEFERLGYIWLDFHLVGIRSKADKPDAFDDLMILINGNNTTYFSCTTNPGTYWLKKLLNPKGAALLKPNQYLQGWKFGMHQGKYEALVQNREVTVYRDRNKNDKSEETNITETGYFGINIHRTGTSTTSVLNLNWSAGCQVLNNPADFKELMHQCKLSNKKTFTYTLLREP